MTPPNPPQELLPCPRCKHCLLMEQRSGNGKRILCIPCSDEGFYIYAFGADLETAKSVWGHASKSVDDGAAADYPSPVSVGEVATREDAGTAALQSIGNAESKDGASALDAAIARIKIYRDIEEQAAQNYIEENGDDGGEVELWQFVNDLTRIMDAATQRSSQGDKNYSPRIVHITQWDDEHDINLECRFDDGQKFAAVKVSHPMQGLADYIQRCLEAQVDCDCHNHHQQVYDICHGIDENNPGKDRAAPVMSPEAFCGEIIKVCNKWGYEGWPEHFLAVIEQRDAALKLQWEGERK